MYGFPQAVAAIDCCHIRLKATNKDREDYINRKENHSIVIQGLVDNRYLFRDIFAGKFHNARIFKNSPLNKECQKKSFLPINMLKKNWLSRTESLNACDTEYFLENWLLKPCSDRGNLIPDEARLNFALSSIRVVVENAFGCLKGRFQRIEKRLDTTLEHIVNIVTTCCILHNFCIITKQRFLHKWLQQTEVDLVNTSRYDEAVNEAESIRSAIRDYLAHHRSLFLNILKNKITITVAKYIFKHPKGKRKDKN